MTRNSLRPLFGCLAMVAGLLSGSSAFAQTLQLQLQQGATTITIQDNQAGDTNPGLGIISFSGTVGVLNDINLFAALSKPAIGTPNHGEMDAFVSVTNRGTGGPLVVRMTDVNFPGVLIGSATLTSAIGGNSRNASGVVQAYLDPSNAPFGTGVGVCTSGPQAVSGAGFQDLAVANCPVAGPFSMTIVDTLNVPGSSEIGFDHNVSADTPLCGTIGDFVWFDTNRNGIQDPGEPGIDGVRLFLESAGGDVLAATVTGPHPIGGASGYYQFPGACAGEYKVIVDASTVPAGYAATISNVGDPATDSNGSPATVVLPVDGAEDQTIDFGYLSPCTGRIGDFVWHDLNRDGVQDPGEPGIPGITVELVGTGQTDVTDANGFYHFEGLCAGTYTVAVVTPPPGKAASPTGVGNPALDSNPSPTVTILTDDDSEDLTLDFGYFTPCVGEIGNFVWLDIDRDGRQDPGEPGIQGVQVVLKDSGGTVLATAFTDANGHYLFAGLCGGDYIVEVVPASVPPTLSPSPSLVGTPDLDSNGSPTTVALPPDSSDLTIDFGYMPPCTGRLGDFVWHDLNRNGIQDVGEPGIPGVTLELRRADNTLIGVTTTDANGFYLFQGLCADTYKVVVLPPAGYNATITGAGSDTAVDSNPNPAVVILPAHNSEDLTIDFGFYQPAALGDRVWYDSNINGQQDPGEPGIAGVAVTLRQCGTGALVANTVTNGSGLYLFSNLVPGCYYVQFATPAGHTPTAANVGADVSDSDSVGGTTGNYTLVAGETNLTVDAGFYNLAGIGDFVWKDLNSNGVQNAGEPGIPGVLVTLQRCDGSVVSSVNTDANGKYLFTNLVPSCYRVAFATPAGMTPSPANSGSDDTLDSDSVAGVSGNYTLSPGETNLTVDAGFYVSTPPICIDATFDFSTGSGSSLKGTAGNVRTFSAGGVNVHASAFGRNKSTGAFAPAFLGHFSLGLGVTDSTESGSGNTHVVDNSGQDNYILFEFSQDVVIDRAYLAYVVGDSDVTVWIGSVPNAYNSHINLNAATLTGLGFTEVNNGGEDDRWAELNAGGVSGNVLVIAAKVGESTDGFKLKKLDIGCPTPGGICVPVGTVSLAGSSSSSGTKGNIRSYSVGGVNIKAAGFSRADSGGAWDKAFLGAYSHGLGVTDTSEGDGSNNRHTVDNIGGRDNYVMFVFSQAVEVSRAFLDYVGADSDITVWVGNVLNAYTTPPMLSDALLAAFVKDTNLTASADSRWADFNAAGNKGNVFVIAAQADDTSPEDSFKLLKLDIPCK